MNSFVVRTNVNELIVSIKNVKRDVVDIYIYGMNHEFDINDNGLPVIPTLYIEHAKRGVNATFNDIFAEVERGINYHFVFNDTAKKEFKEWLENRLNAKDIY